MPEPRLADLQTVRGLVAAPGAADHKYSRGVVLLATGSERFPGAAVLGAAGALGIGAGMARYLGPEAPSRLVLSAIPEVVLGDGGRAHAVVLGSGMPPLADEPDADAWRARLAGDVPAVADAGALSLIEAAGPDAPPRALVLTPHAGELAVLAARLGIEAATPDGLPAAVARGTGAVVLAKGARTVAAAPDGSTLLVEAPSHWAASAGTGDVLAGALGALLARASAADAERGIAASRLAELAAGAAWLHGWAAWAAARRAAGSRLDAHELAEAMAGEAPPADPTGPIRALELAESLPLAVAAVLAS